MSRLNIIKNYFFRKNKAFYPISMVIELTNHCNISCIMCPHHKMQRPKGMMESGLFYKIIDEIAGKVDVVALHGMGESLIHPEISNYIAYCKEKGVQTYLSTNGTLLTYDVVKALFLAGLDFLLIDFDGETKEEYEKIRFKAKYEVVYQNIKNAIALKKELHAKTIITLQTILFSDCKKNIKERFTKEELKLVQIRYKIFHNTFDTDQTSVVEHYRPCFMLWHQMAIMWDGTVPLCCVDYDGAVTFGNIQKDSVFAVWNSEKIKDMRLLHSTLNYQSVPQCRSCGVPNMPYYNPAAIFVSTLLGGVITRKFMYLGECLCNLVDKVLKK